MLQAALALGPLNGSRLERRLARHRLPQRTRMETLARPLRPLLAPRAPARHGARERPDAPVARPAPVGAAAMHDQMDAAQQPPTPAKSAPQTAGRRGAGRRGTNRRHPQPAHQGRCQPQRPAAGSPAPARRPDVAAARAGHAATPGAPDHRAAAPAAHAPLARRAARPAAGPAPDPAPQRGLGRRATEPRPGRCGARSRRACSSWPT